jgi:fructokinase
MTGSGALVIGETLTDIVVTADRHGDGESNEADQAGQADQEHPGGSPFNVAITLGRLGDAVTLLTSIGEDARGAEISKRLAKSHVTLHPESLSSGPTSTARALLQADGSADYVFDIEWDLPAELDLPRTAVTHTGSIGAFLEPGASRVAEVLRERAGGSLITFDPNIRPALVGRRAAALTRVEELLVVTDLVKLSDEDAAWLWPGDDPATVLRHLVSRGPGLAVMTRGGEGSLLATESGFVEVPAPATKVVDTIGAGDSYMGALIHLLLTTSLGEKLRDGVTPREDELASFGAFASRVAAITVSRAGANPPKLAEVE